MIIFYYNMHDVIDVYINNRDLNSIVLKIETIRQIGQNVILKFSRSCCTHFIARIQSGSR